MMHARTLFTAGLFLLVAPVAGWAAGAEDFGPALRGPVVGYVFDATQKAIRPVNGIPGSALLGAPLTFAFPVTAAAFSPRGDFALAISGSSVYLLRNILRPFQAEVLEGEFISAERVILNSDGSVAALYDGEARQIQLLRGLPSTPTVEPALDLSSLSGKITAIAIDRTGSNVLIAVSADGGALYVASAGQPIRPVASFESPSALALAHDDHDVIVADAASNQLTLIRNFAGTPEPAWLAGARDGVSNPVGLAVSSDNRTLYVANAATRTLDVWNLEAQSVVTSLALDAEPTRLTSFQSSSMFVLNDVGDHPLLLLETAVNPAVYFVPAGEDRYR
jgi:DNA-binding beta-propeller fold protein YncE